MKVSKAQFNGMKAVLRQLVLIQAQVQVECNRVDPTDASNSAGFLINAGDSINQTVRMYGRAVGALDEHWTAK
jgi:hypothetical protein